MADCLNCKSCIRYEVYDGQWGRFIWDKKCSKNVRVFIDGKMNPWDMECHLFEYGEPDFKPMTEQEKRKY